LLVADRFPVFETGRGGQFTYHGPGQRVAYVMLDVKKRGADVRQFVRDLEEWVIRTLARFNVRAERREGRVGLWVADGPLDSGGREDKIAAIGIRLRHWVSFHGIAINVDPDLSHFSGIVPCGITESAATPYGVTSLAKLGQMVTLPELDIALKAAFAEVFGE
jgi:lipoyl(octanoyl) transferase